MPYSLFGHSTTRNRFSLVRPPGLVFYVDFEHPEQQGYALNYNGTTGYLTNATADFRSGDSQGSIEVWFRTSETGLTQTLFASADIGTATSFIRLFITTADVIGLAQQAADTLDSITGATVVNDGKWHHVVVSSDGTAWTILLDGVAESLSVISGSNTGDWFADTALRDNLTIGALVKTTTANYAQADIGFTRIYSREMLVAEALTNFQRGRKAAASDTTGLVFNLPCTEGTGNPVDTIGSLTMTVTGGATWIESLTDRSTNALVLTSLLPTWGATGRSFDGGGAADDYIQVPHHASQLLTGGLTIIADINPTSIGETTGRIVHKASAVGGTAGFLFYLAAANQLSVIVNGGATVLSTANITYSVRHIVAVTCTAAGLVTHYKNGAQNGTPASTNALSGITATNDMYIGNESGGTRTWDGLIKRLGIWNRVFMAGEVNRVSQAWIAS